MKTVSWSALWHKFVASLRGKQPLTEKPDEERLTVELRSDFAEKMKAIEKGERLHPAMMTAGERHRETAKELSKLDWSKSFLDYWGAVAGFQAIGERPRPHGRATAFLFVLTREEREEITGIIREEVHRALKATQVVHGAAK